jgi:hypothetical protein
MGIKIQKEKGEGIAEAGEVWESLNFKLWHRTGRRALATVMRL